MLGFPNAIFQNTLRRGGGSSPGVYPTNAQGVLTYKKTGSLEYSGVTFDTSYAIYYKEVFDDGSISPVQSQLVNLSIGVNPAVIIASTEEPGVRDISVIMTVADSLLVSNTPNEWFHDLNNVKSEVTISGGAYSNTFGGYRTYVGAYDPALGFGDYTFSGSFTDPNGVVTQASNNDLIKAKYVPKTFIVAYRLNGVDWVTDVEPPVETSGYETIDLQYVINTDYALDENTNPVYDVDGSIGYVGGTVVTEVAVPLAHGDNELTILNVPDSSGQLQDTEVFNITRIPTLTYVGLTAIDEETYGTTYAATDTLAVDQGLSNQTIATPEETPYSFISGDYRDYNFNASYTYPSTNVGNTIPIVITYQEFAQQDILEDDREGIVAQMGQSPQDTNLIDDLEGIVAQLGV